MRTASEVGSLTIEVLVDGTMQTINDEDSGHPHSVIGKILTERVSKSEVAYRLIDCGHDKEIPHDATHVVFYHCGLAAPPGKFKGHIITTPSGTTTGATDDGQDELAHNTMQTVCAYIDRVRQSDPDRKIIINFAGYSRGAIVTGHLTNELHKIYKNDHLIVLNRAIGIDPVAGSSAGCLLTNEKKLNQYTKNPGKFAPVDTKVWGPVRFLNLYFATEGTRAHFQAQTPHGVTTDRGRRVINFYDKTQVTVTNIATSHFAIACIVDSDESHCAFPILILECFLKDRDLPRFGDDQLLNTAMPYRVSMEQIRLCLLHYAGLGVREIEPFGLFWKLANLLFTGSHRYQRPLIARDILTEDHPVLHASYRRSVMMDAVGFIKKLADTGYIGERVIDIACNAGHSLNRFLLDCYRRSSYYQAAFQELETALPDKDTESIDRVLLQGAFLKRCIEQLLLMPYSTTKRQLSELGCMQAKHYLQTTKTVSAVIVARSIQSFLIKQIAKTPESRSAFLTGPRMIKLPRTETSKEFGVEEYKESAGVAESKGSDYC